MSSEKYQMLAKTFGGLEEVLKGELVELGASEVEALNRGVKFSGSKEILYKANFCCRTALQIFRLLGEFKIKTSADIYDSISSIEWSEIFDIKQSFAINCFADSEAFNNSTFVSLKAKDAIVDHFKNKFKKRPVVSDSPNVNIHVFASSDTMTVLIDSSGEILSKRGYRINSSDTSLNEVLAAGLLKLAGWKGQTDLYDVMCGSGTVSIEAALIARNIPPGIFRSEFAFEKWNDFDADLLEEVYNDDYEIEFGHTIYASDVSLVSINVATLNAKGAGVLKSIEFEGVGLASLKPKTEKGLLIIIPPQADRKNENLIESVYSLIGHQLKKSFSGFDAWVYSNSEIGFKKIGLRPSTSFEFFNSNNESSFRHFELYGGFKKETDRPFEKQKYDSKPVLGQRDFKSVGRRSDVRPVVRREGKSDYNKDNSSTGGRRVKPRTDLKRDAARNDSRTERRSEGGRMGTRREESRSDFKRDAGKSVFRKPGFSKPDDRRGNFNPDSRMKGDDTESRRAKFHSDRLKTLISNDQTTGSARNEVSGDENRTDSQKTVKKRKRITINKDDKKMD